MDAAGNEEIKKRKENSVDDEADDNMKDASFGFDDLALVVASGDVLIAG